MQNEMISEQYEAEFAAEQDAKTDGNKIVWIIYGVFVIFIFEFLLIPFIVVGIINPKSKLLIYPPTPPAQRFVDKSESYKEFYTNAYKAKMKHLHWTYTAIGLAIIIVGMTIFIYVNNF